MTGCAQVETFLATADPTSRRQPPQDVREHLERCAACRSIWEFASAREPAEASAETRARIEEQIKASLSPVRPIACRKTLTLAFLGIFGLSAGAWIWLIGWAATKGMSGAQMMGTLAAVAAAAAFASAILSGEMVPGERRIAPVGWLVLAAVASLGVLIATLFPWESIGPTWLAATMNCHTHGALIGIPTAVIAVLALRRGAPLHPATAGAAVGMLAGLAAMAALHFGCSMHGALHITAGHLSVPAGGAVIGYLVGKGAALWNARAEARSLGG
jgi:hypothetical protein